MNDDFEYEIGTEENKFKIEMINNELFIDDIQIEDNQHSPLYSLVKEVYILRAKIKNSDPWS